MAGIEWRRRVILDAELNRPGGHLTCDLRYDTQTEIDTRGDASRRDEVAVLHDPGLLVRRPDQK